MRRFRSDSGLSSVELGLILPLLLLLIAIVMPVVQAGWEYMALSRASANGIRYATRVDTNARVGAGGYLTRRPSAGEVQSFVGDAAKPLNLSSVSVSPDPQQTLSGDIITLRTTYTVSFGPLASLANSVKSTFFGGGNLLPESKTITVSAVGREE